MTVDITTAFADGTTFVEFGYCPACDGAPSHYPHNAACAIYPTRPDPIREPRWLTWTKATNDVKEF